MDTWYNALNPSLDLGRLLHLMSDHVREVFGDEGNLNVGQMTAVTNAGMARVFTANVDNEIVGYSIYFLGRDLFRAHIKTADCVAIYMKPKYRSLARIRRLIMMAEQSLTDFDGVNKVTTSANLNPRHKALYQRFGYKPYYDQLVKDV